MSGFSIGQKLPEENSTTSDARLSQEHLQVDSQKGSQAGSQADPQR